MKESLRRVILFTAIVITGLVMILFDVPLILMVPLILAAGFVILFLLGAITVVDIRSVFIKKKIKNPKKISIIQRLDEMKFFEKPQVQPDNLRASSDKKEMIPKSAAKKTSADSPLRSFFTSLGSLRSVLKERSKQAKKVEHIDELLDKTVSETVKTSALERAGNIADTITPSPESNGGPGLNEQEKDLDPFLSLSGDDFDASFFDGLDEQDTPQSPPLRRTPAAGIPVTGSSLVTDEHEIPMPSLDITSESDDILKDIVGDLEEFRDLEGEESIDQDFGVLDTVNIYAIDPDADSTEKIPPAKGSSPSQAKSPIKTIKVEGIVSDPKKGVDLPEDKISIPSDIDSFTGGSSGTDADLLSTLASDVRKVAKEKNPDMMRDLQDFKVPATEIENELKDTFGRMKAGQNSGKKPIKTPKKTE